MIALLSATAQESLLLQQELAGAAETRCGHYMLRKGRIAGLPVSLLHCGVGKVSAALATEALLGFRKPAVVILFGCGGAYPGSGMRIGDLALAREEIYGDEGVQTPAGFLDMLQLGFPLGETSDGPFYNRLPLDPHLADSARATLKPSVAASGHSLIDGSFVTVSCCSGTNALSQALASRTGGICENMEGAAVAQVCRQHDVQLLELRGISNLTGDRDPAAWNMAGGAEAAQRAVLTLLAAWEEVSQAL
jgi:futalosine hydrolase